MYPKIHAQQKNYKELNEYLPIISASYFPFRYEDEINKRASVENDFVLLKKVSQLWEPISG